MIRPILNAEETIKGAKILVNQKPYFLYIELKRMGSVKKRKQ